MLGGATIAGLSSAYKIQADEVGRQLGWARGAYYVSIVMLVVSVSAALNLIPGFIHGLPALPSFNGNTPTGSIAVQTLAGLGSRALVILPALLLAGFAAHRHSMLFRLREEYSHKYAIAASVHGFKQQAPQFEQQIAAAVFKELLQNPAETMDKQSKPNSGNGFVARMITPHIDTALSRMSRINNEVEAKESSFRA